jgi:hypothetical protein
MKLKLKSKAIIAITTCLLFSCTNGTKDPNNAGQATDSLQAPHQSGVTKADTVNRPEIVTPQTDGSLLLTAENGKPIGPDIKYMPEWKAFGWFTPADRVEWDVNTSKTGEYEVHLEWSVSDEEAGKEFLLEGKDQQLTGVVGKTGSWETYKNENIGKINLSEGHHTIIFRAKNKSDTGALLDLRQIKLVATK